MSSNSKLNRSLNEDYIPLSSNKSKDIKESKKNNKKRKTSHSIYGDTKLIPYMTEILKDNSCNDIDSIVSDLRKKHPEYNRKQKAVLKQCVSKALVIINKQLDNDVDCNFSYSSNDFESDTDSKPNNNLLNSSVNDLYMKKRRQTNDRDSKKINKSNSNEHSNKMNNKIDRDINNLIEKQAKLKERYLINSETTFNDFGGIIPIVNEIKKLLLHLRHPILYTTIGIEPLRGFLLHGPPGVGKTKIVEAIANDLKVPCIKCGATEIVSGISGESEEKLRELFNLAKCMEPCLLFIDEIDAITPKRENASREMERRIVTQLLTCLDDLGSNSKVIVIGTTNRPDAIDIALRRAGRFDREIVLGIPDEISRIDIIKVLSRNIKLCNNFDYQLLAHKTPGFVGVDLKILIREAAMNALDRVLCKFNVNISSALNEFNFNIEEISASLSIEMSDFEAALKQVQPSSKREGFATIPDVTWGDVGALKNIREELQLSILALVQYKDDVKQLGLPTSMGILLCGPPGCGKTLLAKAIANESGINFISVKGPELLNMYVGESERAVRSVFNRARDSKPCVIFFDEIDALCPKRNDSESSNFSSRVVNQLLTEMDGLESRECFLLAATNRPDILDPAILRPGRFDKILFVDFPSPNDRLEILRTLTKNGTKPPLSADVDLVKIANDSRVDGFTGADLQSLIRESSLLALKQRISGEIDAKATIVLTRSHFEHALQKIKSSVSKSERNYFQQMNSIYTINRYK